MRAIRISGLKTCGTTRKALAAFEAAGREAEFRDLRLDPPDATEVRRLWEAIGPALLNRSSTTWRGLSEAERAGDPQALLAAHPALIKRPVIEDGGRITSGWGPAQQEAWLP